MKRSRLALLGLVLFGCWSAACGPASTAADEQAQARRNGSPGVLLSGTAPSGNRCPDLGGAKLFSVGAWWQEIGRPVVDDPPHPNSAALMARFGKGNLKLEMSTTTAKGGNSLSGMPYNVVPETQPRLPIKIAPYKSPDDPKTVPFFRGMSIERWHSPDGAPPKPGKFTGDHHALVFRRDDATGKIKELIEANYVESPDGGATWEAHGIARWDLETGKPRLDANSSGDAAGLPIAPLLIRYDEIKRGRIDHPLRLAIPAGTSMNKYVWPARATAYNGVGDDVLVVCDAPAAAGATELRVKPLRTWPSGTPLFPAGTVLQFSAGSYATPAVTTADVPGGETTIPIKPLPAPIAAGDCATVSVGIPMGGRLRLKKSWFDANRKAASPTVQVLLDALRQYGGIVTDLTTGGLYLNGVNDERWTTAEIREISSIPSSAFEVLAPKLKVSFTGPSLGQVGRPLTYTAKHEIPGDSRFSTNIYFNQSANGGATWTGAGLKPGAAVCDDAHRGPFTVTFTPPAAGTYLVRAQPYVDWLRPPAISVTVTGGPPQASPPRTRSTPRKAAPPLRKSRTP